MLKNKTKVVFYNTQNNHAVDLKQVNRIINSIIIIIFFNQFNQYKFALFIFNFSRTASIV